MINRRLSLLDRLELQIHFKPGCWEWMGTKTPLGYGVIGHQYKKLMAHRVAYEAFVDSVPEGMDLDHLCRNPGCCNPTHLEPVSHRENCLRGTGFSAVNAARTTCTRGHPFDSENTYVQPDGRRKCRECARAYMRQWKARHRGHGSRLS